MSIENTIMSTINNLREMQFVNDYTITGSFILLGLISYHKYSSKRYKNKYVNEKKSGIGYNKKIIR